MKNYLNKILFLLLFMFLINFNVFTQNSALKFNADTGIATNLTGKTLKEVTDAMIFGNLIDMYFPSNLVNCFLFVYKNNNSIIKIAANTEFTINDEDVLSEHLEKFIAIGYYSIDYFDNRSIRMFKGPSYKTPFDILHNINPEQYISIKDIELLLGVYFDNIDRGGFISPFFLYICKLENGRLELLASPSEDKKNSYFMGGWSFIKK